jgi:hypothetical protein
MADYQMESGNCWLDECKSYVLKDDRKNDCEQVTSITINAFYSGYVASLVEEYQPKTRKELRSLKPFSIAADKHISFYIKGIYDEFERNPPEKGRLLARPVYLAMKEIAPYK